MFYVINFFKIMKQNLVNISTVVLFLNDGKNMSVNDINIFLLKEFGIRLTITKKILFNWQRDMIKNSGYGKLFLRYKYDQNKFFLSSTFKNYASLDGIDVIYNVEKVSNEIKIKLSQYYKILGYKPSDIKKLQCVKHDKIIRKFTDENGGSVYEKRLNFKNGTIPITEWNKISNSEKISDRVSIKFNSDIIGNCNFEKLSYIYKHQLFHNCIDFKSSIFEKVDCIDPKTKQLYEIKKMGNKKTCIFTDPFTIKHDSDIHRLEQYMSIVEYNYTIEKIHQNYGEKVCNMITEKELEKDIKIQTGKNVYEFNKDFKLESRFVNSRFPNIKKWEITVVLN